MGCSLGLLLMHANTDSTYYIMALPMKLDYIAPRGELLRLAPQDILINWSNTQMDDFDDGGNLEELDGNDFSVVEDPTTPKRVHF